MPSVHRLLLLSSARSPEEPLLPQWLLRRLLRASRSPVHPAAVLTLEEIHASFNGHEEEFPPVLNLRQAAALAHVHPGTLKRWFSHGRFRTSVRRSKPLLIWRDRFVQELMRK